MINLEELQVEYLQEAIPGHGHSLWYGGRVVEAKYKGYTFILGAYGDVYASLIEPGTGVEVAEVRDKCNYGAFLEEMRPYIANDTELHLYMHPDDAPHVTVPYNLVLDHNNWWEVLIDGPDGKQYDFGWVLDADYISEAVNEMMAGMEEMIEQIETERKNA